MMLRSILIGLIVAFILEGASSSHQILLLLEHLRLILKLTLCVLSACLILLTIAILFLTFVFIFPELGILLIDHPVRLGCLHDRTSSLVFLELILS
jgi:hypothetical protein